MVSSLTQSFFVKYIAATNDGGFDDSDSTMISQKPNPSNRQKRRRDKKSKGIKRPEKIFCPIFIVGAPRSGTNIFYRTLALHPDLAWISNITKKIPSSLWLTRIIMLFRDDHRPTEANNVWQKFTGNDHEALGRDDVTAAAGKYLRTVVQNNLRIFNKPRFVNKCPGNSVRIEFLKEIFPDAIFIHIIRDGRAVGYSIIRSRLEHSGAYWSVKPPDWQDLLELPLVDACALQWKMTVKAILQSAKKLSRKQYMAVKYEDLVARPAEIFKQVAEKCDLVWPEDLLQTITAGMENRNYKWQTEMQDADKNRLNVLLCDFLKQLGYEV